MTNKKGAAAKFIICILLVVIVCMGTYIIQLTGADKEPSATADAPEVEETVAPVTPPAVETDADNTAAVEVKTGFILESDMVYAIEDAPMWSDYNTDSKKVGTLAFGDCEVRLGQGYGEAEGWSRFMPTPNGGFVYIESKYLNTEKPVVGGAEIEANAGSTNNNPTQINSDGSPVLPDSETDMTIDNSDGWFPSPETTTDDQKPVEQTPTTPVEDEQNQDQNVSNPNPQGDKSQEEFLKELAAQLGAQYTPDGEGSSADHIVDPETSGSNTDHDYSGITISP